MDSETSSGGRFCQKKRSAKILPGTGRCPLLGAEGSSVIHTPQAIILLNRPDPSVGFAATSPFRGGIYEARCPTSLKSTIINPMIDFVT